MTRFGPLIRRDGTLFRLWAPSASGVSLVLPDAEAQPMQPRGDGWYERLVPAAGPGTRYMFRVGELDVPDPASRGQADDAIGWSVVQADRPTRPVPRRTVRPWHEAIAVELHTGTATPEGTFSALAGRLGHFAEAGYTAIELMPVSDFAGRWNWGYDGVLPFAPDRRYGTPDDLAGLVDAAHGHGLSIILDVVYNHFGPEGNYLHAYAESFFSNDVVTPWGPAISLDQETVRAFFIENAVQWVDGFDFDGLRFDAVHALKTSGRDPFLRELAAALRAVKPDAQLVLENEQNLASWLERSSEGMPQHYTAQWNDDMHHVLHVVTTGETTDYYGDYADDAPGHLARGLSEGFVYQGEPSPWRDGEPRGEPSGHLPPDAFMAFVQNHDQIGNRPLGDRLTATLEPAPTALLYFVLLLSPQVPLLFMGEEAGLDTPFPFFCDFHGELAEGIRKGRRAEFEGFFAAHEGSVDDLPDPLAESTFKSARYAWDRLAEEASGTALSSFRHLADARRRLVWPLTGTAFQGAETERAGNALRVTWRFADGTLTMLLNPSGTPTVLSAPDREPDETAGTVQRNPEGVRLDGWAAALWSDVGAMA